MKAEVEVLKWRIAARYGLPPEVVGWTIEQLAIARYIFTQKRGIER